MFRKILIANRGEIACRVIATARAMGVRTVAVYSDADRDARHVALADEARHIGPAEARASYLNIEAILSAARARGAEAIHPGYGFLSENEDFARACASAGLVFIGPTPEAIAAMGDKAAAKRLMEKAGVPLVPGYHGEKQEPGFLQTEAGRIGYPVLIKASAGGGGKGMRVVADGKGFVAALESARREAKSAFGDDTVLVEKYLERPRHIEVQVFGDTHGNVVHLFERDCSVQRRHQKVLEEAPAPGLSAEKRNEIGSAAVAAAKAIKYVGAGTVEFIAGQDGRFYFMEMNTRLQVEHPVTEMITGLDLVEWQLRVASGDPLPLKQDEIRMKGHAIEARIYAENPDKGFLPSTGRLRHLRFPPAPARVDTGVREGDAITPHYDPMIAKLIVWGEDRAVALGRLRAALAATEIIGVSSNVAFLARVAAGKAFASADLDTGLIERCRDELFPKAAPASDEELAAAALAELQLEETQSAARAHGSSDPHSPWGRVDGWRLNLGSHHEIAFADGGAIRKVQIHFAAAGPRTTVEGRDASPSRVRAVRDGADWHLFGDGAHGLLRLHDEHAVASADEAAGSLAAPMPGKVLQVLVKPGAQVAKGAALLVLEAMKMEHTIAAPCDGRIKRILFAPGEQVSEGAELLEMEKA
ncbi:MAG TPA: acetyl/propionyl/methylcrotonyl-CoA carboxylase subunit alpha [Burkholderiales bacterium]|nr:acetyl/propionyl/methylcrotonyl-CoA carboxylase subunit alpha [Burkholderiales bacterium]